MTLTRIPCILGLFLFFYILGCVDGYPTGTSELDKVVSEVQMSPDSAAIYSGATKQFTAVVRDQFGDEILDVQVEWSSSDTAIAVIDSNGLTTAQDTGTVVLTASLESVSDTAFLTVFLRELPMGFPEDFPDQYDHLTGNQLDGWGGGPGESAKTPIVFVHGNGHTAENWRYLANVLLDSGYVPSELWALSYLDFIGGDSANANMANVPEIEYFIESVLTYSGREKVVIISHSLGVTLSRAWMKYFNGYTNVSHFIGIAGANHGVSFCGYDTVSILCREVGHPESEFLTWLNKPTETPRADITAYMTVYDGTGTDMFFPENAIMNDGSIVDLRYSPMLSGAHNLQVPGVNHFTLPNVPETIGGILEFLETN